MEFVMRYAPAALMSALLLAGCGPRADAPVASSTAEMSPAPVETSPVPTSTARLPATTPLSAHGWGPVTIGMSLDQVTKALGPDANPEALGGPDPESCTEFRPTNAPEGLMVMMVEGKLARISLIDLSKVKTDAGFGVGVPAATVKESYGARASVTPHKYQDAPAEYITVWTSGPRKEPYVEDPAARGIVYEIDGTGKVGAIHAGGPAIQYVEGCA